MTEDWQSRNDPLKTLWIQFIYDPALQRKLYLAQSCLAQKQHFLTVFPTNLKLEYKHFFNSCYRCKLVQFKL